MSAKTGAQGTRRTPLSLTASSTKQTQQLLQRATVNISDIATNSKNDIKTSSSPSHKSEQTVSTTHSPNQRNAKQSNAAEKRSHQHTSKIPTIIEKSSLSLTVKRSERNEEKKTQNGVGAGSNNTNAEKQPKEKQQFNGKEENEAVKDKKDNKEEKMEKGGKSSTNLEKKEKLETQLEKKKDFEKEPEIEKMQKEVKEKEKQIEKKDEENQREKEMGNEIQNGSKIEEKVEVAKVEECKSENEPCLKRTTAAEVSEEKSLQKDEDMEKLDISVGEDKSQPQTPTTTSNVSTPIKELYVQPSPKKSTPQNNAQAPVLDTIASIDSTTTVAIKSVTTAVDDDEMDPLPVASTSPKKAVVHNDIQPTATSTPGKFLGFFSSRSSSKVNEEKPSIDPQYSERRHFQSSQISGRRSIRSYESNASSYYQSNIANRESYRRINTELDVSSVTNTSLNVTVGSEVPNNSSFSFFTRSRKRERSPPKLPKQSAIDLDVEPAKSPKRARMEKQGFFSIVASPLTMLRSRFSKASITTPTKLKCSPKQLCNADAADDEDEVQNVSGISVEENSDLLSVTEEVTVGTEAAEKETSQSSTLAEDDSEVDVEKMETEDENDLEAKTTLSNSDEEADMKKFSDVENNENNSDTVNVENSEGVPKKSRCSVM